MSLEYQRLDKMCNHNALDLEQVVALCSIVVSSRSVEVLLKLRFYWSMDEYCPQWLSLIS